MSYGLVKITTFYKEYLSDYYSRNPSAGRLSYAEQFEHLMGDAFGWSDFYTRQLRTIGVDAHEIVANAYPLQSAWARENGVRTVEKDLVVEQLKRLKPQVVFIQDTSVFNGEWVSMLKEKVPSIRQIIGWCCYPYTDEQLRRFRVFNYMLTCTPGFVADFETVGMKAHLLYHAFEASLLPKIRSDNAYPDVDLLFAGSIGAAKGYHASRRELFEELINSGVLLNIYTSLQTARPLYMLMKQGAYATASLLRHLGLGSAASRIPGVAKIFSLEEFPRRTKYRSAIRKVVHRPLYGLEMLKALSRAKIGLNIHIDVAGKYAGNIRLFEVTGVGSCLLTDAKVNLPDLFDVQNEIVTYTSPQDCMEKVQWLVRDSQARSAIAQAGMNRTHQDHTFAKRAQQLHGIILKTL
jgi:spore maturation protein CgeB